MDAGAEVFVNSHDVVLWAGLCKVNCNCHPLIKGGGCLSANDNYCASLGTIPRCDGRS